MIIVKTAKQLKHFITNEKRAGRSIGFVPTMGALHEGHLSLVKNCIKANDICVTSIFVNPTQFNDRQDLVNYPRTMEKDCLLLESSGCDYIFTPSENEMYPEPDIRVFDLGYVTTVMEGASRPGHFNGVAQVVSKLFDMVEPDKAYFGEKDFQQVAVIREMVKRLDIGVQIIACPTVREKDGLAFSSRNARLTTEQRQIAPVIAATLKESLTFVPKKTIQEVAQWVINTLQSEPLLRVDYFEIVDGKRLLPLQDWMECEEPVGCIAVFCGEVRLIDNINYKFSR
ncbi:MAG: pantoate--beta-alanine ligase [Tannerella sp.]|jgi:pantoate--beta-alanine ligase|nr:pantoate--beta-alanine ligase [Tannerella sp.]